MTPDHLEPSKTRKAWRAMSALGCLLGAASLFVTAVKWNDVDRRQDRQAAASEHAICAVVLYAEKQVDQIVSSPDLERLPPARRRRAIQTATGLDRLAADMRATGVRCPKR